ncbi:MAG: hypothetical protein QM736_14600 [Vicinamibacterales bacterium]
MTFTSVGRIFLAVTNATRTQSLNVDLEITDDVDTSPASPQCSWITTRCICSP